MHYLLGLAPKSLDLTPGSIWFEIISSRASRVLSTLIFPLNARISIPPVLEENEDDRSRLTLFDSSPVGGQPVVSVELDLAVLVHLGLVLRHRLQ